MVLDQVYKEVVETASTNKSDRVRDARDMQIGECARQGDIYIHKVDPSHAHGEVSRSHQLAHGNSRGSRHIATGEEVVVYDGTTLPTYCKSDTYLGPMVKSSTEFMITHPEHADFKLSAGCYQITHQQNMITKKRVVD